MNRNEKLRDTFDWFKFTVYAGISSIIALVVYSTSPEIVNTWLWPILLIFGLVFQIHQTWKTGKVISQRAKDNKIISKRLEQPQDNSYEAEDDTENDESLKIENSQL